MTNPFVKVLYKALPFSVIDFTFVLKGLCQEELPERALGTVRICQFLPSQDALLPPGPPILIEKTENTAESVEDEVKQTFASNENGFFAVNSDESSVLTMHKLREQLDQYSDDEIILKYRGECEALVDILSDVLIPVKKYSVTALNGLEEPMMTEAPVLSGLNAYDLLRYLFGSEFNLKAAAVKIVESAAWRGVTFPVDLRACRVSLPLFFYPDFE